MATPPSEEIVTLVAAQAAARVRLAEATAAGVRAQVGAFADWYSDAAVAVFAQRLARLTQGGARNTAAITDAYLARSEWWTPRRFARASIPTGCMPAWRPSTDTWPLWTSAPTKRSSGSPSGPA
jgi:hypothetical protein